MNIHLKALGCRLNEAELENWAREFNAAGHHIVNAAADADITVLNTCAVTTEAVRKSRKLINRSRRDNPAARLVVSGCFVSTGESGDATELGVDLLVDNRDKGKLVESVIERWQTPVMPQGATAPAEYSLFERNRQRAFIKIQDGCRYRCSYCIVTIARGEEVSRPIQDITDEINSLHQSGVQEAVLTGVHVGGYGSDIKSNLKRLVQAILAHTDIPRVRFASVEPWDLGDDFFELFENPRLLPHMHLPLQSGADSVLRRMSRRCHTADFESLVTQAKSAVPGFNVTTDVIVGFPGESEQEWQQALAFIDRMSFGHIHIFSFSARKGTKAATMPNQIEESVKRARSAQLHELARQHQLQTLRSNVGQDHQVLWEKVSQSPDAPAIISGYTPNYLRVKAPLNEAFSVNGISACRISDVDEKNALALAVPVNQSPGD